MHRQKFSVDREVALSAALQLRMLYMLLHAAAAVRLQ
jgi:hypothetical protein